MLMDLGPNVYCEDFEQHFLAKAAEFYQVRVLALLQCMRTDRLTPRVERPHKCRLHIDMGCARGAAKTGHQTDIVQLHLPRLGSENFSPCSVVNVLLATLLAGIVAF